MGSTLAAAFLLPQMGRLVDRFGLCVLLSVIVVLLGPACAAFGAVANLLWLALGFGALRFRGQVCLMPGCANLASHWFSRGPGLKFCLPNGRSSLHCSCRRSRLGFT